MCKESNESSIILIFAAGGKEKAINSIPEISAEYINSIKERRWISRLARQQQSGLWDTLLLWSAGFINPYFVFIVVAIFCLLD